MVEEKEKEDDDVVEKESFWYEKRMIRRWRTCRWW